MEVAVTAEAGLAAGAQTALAVPEVAFLLIALGYLALATWLALPHLWVWGLAAAPLLIAGSTGLVHLSPTAGAVFLLVLAAASLAMEVLSLPGLMLHAVGGAVALAGAGLWLHGPWAGAHPAVAVPAALAVGWGTWWAARRSWRAARVDPWADSSRLVGRELVVLHVQDGLGHAVVAGHVWPVRDPDRPLQAGRWARVTERRGDELTVRQRRFLFPVEDS